MIRKDAVLAVLITFCLTATLFITRTAISQTEYREYDPWYDVTGPIRDVPDGQIDVRDVYQLSLKYGTDGDPGRNVSVTNLPLDENGNLKVAYSNIPDHGKYTETVNIFSSETHTVETSQRYYGGVPLNYESSYVFAFNPLRVPFNITDAYLQMTVIPNTDSGAYDSAQYNIVINGYTQSALLNKSTVFFYVYVHSVNISNSTLLDSISQGINTLQIDGSCLRNDIPYRLDAYEVTLLIEYEY